MQVAAIASRALDLQNQRANAMNHEKAIAQQRQRRQFRVRKRDSRHADAAAAVRLPQPQAHVRPGDRRLAGPHAGRRQHRRQGAARAAASTAATRRPPRRSARPIAERALAAGIKQVCFDRGAYQYHGRVAALADAAREAGLSF